MAAFTVTLTAVNNRQLLQLPGLNHQLVSYNGADLRPQVTISASLCIQMICIPAGARIIDLWVENHRIEAGGFAVGDGSSTARWIASTSLVITPVTGVTGALTVSALGTVTLAGSLSAGGATPLTRMQRAGGYRISISEDAVQQFDTIDITISGAPTQSRTGTIVMAVFYDFN